MIELGITKHKYSEIYVKMFFLEHMYSEIYVQNLLSRTKGIKGWLPR